MQTVKKIVARKVHARPALLERYFRAPKEEIETEVRTGDLVAFGYAGSHHEIGASMVHTTIRNISRKRVPVEQWTAMTQVVTHVGLIVRDDVFPAAGGQVYVLESTMGGVLNDGVKEFRNRTKFGVQLRKLEEVLDAVDAGHNNTSGMVVWILEPKTRWNTDPTGNDTLLFRTLMHEHLDHGYDGPLSLVMHLNILPMGVRQFMLRHSPFTSSRETCSELVQNIVSHHTGYGQPNPDSANAEFTYPAHLVSAESVFDTAHAWRIFYPSVPSDPERPGVHFTPRFHADRGSPVRSSMPGALNSSSPSADTIGSSDSGDGKGEDGSGVPAPIPVKMRRVNMSPPLDTRPDIVTYEPPEAPTPVAASDSPGPYRADDELVLVPPIPLGYKRKRSRMSAHSSPVGGVPKRTKRRGSRGSGRGLPVSN